MTKEREKSSPDSKKSIKRRSRDSKDSIRRRASQDPAQEDIQGPPDAPVTALDGERAAGLKKWETTFPIICIGASAGGLEALQAFFSNIGDMPCCAYVVITHLEASHPSMLPQLIQRHTSISVTQIANGMPLQDAHAYVIPPDGEVTLTDGHFHLAKRKSDGAAMPINAFMTSLARVARQKAIGVVLSGMGSDGCDGIRAIKDQSGLTIAQDPVTAHFSPMPQNAINSGLIDYVLAPKDMPGAIADYVNQHAGLATMASRKLDKASKEALHEILSVLRQASGHDFSSYKTNTLVRRIQRRMANHQLETMQSYLRYLHENPKEIAVLFKEMLIGVTNFFRDPGAWKIVESKVLPSLLDDKPDGSKVRAWVPGAATGEEAYTLAILLREYMERRHRHLDVQVFATDINEDAIVAGRMGLYPASIAEDMMPERLQRFFTRENSHYRIDRQIREMLIFAPQNLIKDPPFTKLDYICCRNLLIYLDTDLQRRVLPTFHYSLRPGGVLFLGSSESIGDFGSLFETIDSHWKIYRRRESRNIAPIVDFAPRRNEPRATSANDLAGPHVLAQAAQRGLLDHFAPSSVVVKPDGEIVYFHGRTGKYLEPAPGQARLNVNDMAREGLRARLPALIRTAVSQGKKVVVDRLKVQTDGRTDEVTITVQPLRDQGNVERLVLVAFSEASTSEKKQKTRHTTPAHASYVQELERELADSRENLQSIIEELETSNEEMRSINEEYQSTNEELQSANEELETSREEMQSLNEELATVNSELHEKLDTLTHTHEDMKVFLDSLEIPTIFLDRELRILRFTSQARRVVNIMEQDVGRPLAHLVTHLQDVDLLKETQAAHESLQPRRRIVGTHAGDTYLMRILPYRRSEHAVEGVVVTFLARSDWQPCDFEEDSKFLPRHLAESILGMIREPVVLLDQELRVLMANAAFCATFETSEGAVLGKRLDELGEGDWRIRQLRERLEEAICRDAGVENLELHHEFRDMGPKRLILNSRIMRDADHSKRQILLSIREATIRDDP